MDRLLRFAFGLLALLTLVAWASPGDAARPLQMLSQYSHRAWRVQDGAVPVPHAIGQTRDGYLWIGTNTGLFRFDGVRFVEADGTGSDSLKGLNVSALLGTDDGSLWVGSVNVLARVRDGHVVRFPVDGLVRQIIAGDNGAVWFASTNGSVANKQAPVCRIERDSMKCYGPPDFPLGNVQSIAKARDGFWLGASSSVCHWSPGQLSRCYLQDVLHPFRDISGVTALETSPDENLYVGIGQAGPGLGLGRLVDGEWRAFTVETLSGSRLRVSTLAGDRKDLWVGTLDDGLYRVHGDVAERFGTADGLSSDPIQGMFKDREGTMWVATSGGLDAFRELPVSVFSKKQGVASDTAEAVLAARNGTIWLSTDPITTIVDDHPVPAPTFLGHAVSGLALLEDHRGRLWASVGNTLQILEQGRAKVVTDRDHRPVGAVQSMAEDANGEVYVLTIERDDAHLLRIVDDTVVEASPRATADGVIMVLKGSASGLWLGYSTGRISRLDGGRWTSFPAGRDTQSIRDLYIDSADRFLAATNNGLIVQRGPSRRLLDGASGLPCQRMTTVIRDANGAVYIAADCGILVINAAELDRWFRQVDTRIKYHLLAVTDGFRPGRSCCHPRASLAADGRVWFANGAIVEVVDPAAVVVRPAPPIRIEEVTADRVALALEQPLALPAGTKDVVLRYTALSSVAPERIVFQYRLDGRDAAWHDAGTRREAFYTDLPPGAYRFHVRSADSDGGWSGHDASLDFSVLPLYYQTRWFLLLCIGLAALTLYGTYVVRLRQVAASERRNAAIQNQERIRIARELHDTLLQSTQGLILRFQRATKRIPPTEPARDLMERALDRADEVVRESRQRVQNLRTNDDTMDLAETLKLTVAELDELDGSNRLSMTTSGVIRIVDGPIGAEIVMIVREALTNAITHSKATRIETNIAYESSALHVTVVDDGIGMPETVMVGGREGHWGLSSMRERAASIFARLEIKSTAETGTLLTFAIPAASAYFTERSQAPWWGQRVLAFGLGGRRARGPARP